MSLLIRIRDFIKDAQREVSLSELSYHFGQPEDVMRDMVKRWVNKGVIKQTMLISDSSCTSVCSSKNACSGCSSALIAPKMIISYQYNQE